MKFSSRPITGKPFTIPSAGAFPQNCRVPSQFIQPRLTCDISISRSTWLDHLEKTNSTAPSLPFPDEPQQQLADVGERVKRNIPGPWTVRFRLRYQDLDRAPTFTVYPLGRVHIRFQAIDYWRWPPSGIETGLVLDGAGNGILNLPEGDYANAKATLYFENDLFSLKQGRYFNIPTLPPTTWSIPLPVSSYGTNGFMVEYVMPSEIGPNLGHLWWSFHDIRAVAHDLIYLSAVPGTTLWYPFPKPDGTAYYGDLIGIEARYGKGRIVHAHEYGHHVMQHLATGGIPPAGRDESSDHSLCSTVSPRMAYIEGYADAFALHVLHSDSFWWTPGESGVNLAHYVCPVDMDMITSEGRVAAGLLDLLDHERVVPECNHLRPENGRAGYCDLTHDPTTFLFEWVIFRESIVGPRVASIRDWWERLAAAHSTGVDFASALEAMRFNYYPLS